MEEDLNVGDFVWFKYDTKDVYPGRIVSINGDKFKVEICINKRKNAENEVDIVEGTIKQIKPRTLTAHTA